MRFSVDQYDDMVRAGVLTEDDRVELIDGEILEMPPIGAEHNFTTNALSWALASALGDRAVVHAQSSLRLPPDSEPEPDLEILRPPRDLYRHRHPGADDTLLVVEVMQSSHDRDRRRKLPLYARNGIVEVWLVDVPARRVEVYREPRAGRYESSVVIDIGGSVSPLAFPDVSIPVADFIP